jgi:hypothetical protein
MKIVIDLNWTILSRIRWAILAFLFAVILGIIIAIFAPIWCFICAFSMAYQSYRDNSYKDSINLEGIGRMFK